jgi:hydroxymethylbilane synthase
MMIPPMGQAALGIEIVQGNEKLREIAMMLNDETTFLCTKIERDFIAQIGAGCSAPVACNAVRDGENIVFRTMLGYPDASKIMQERAVISVEASENLGREMAEVMIAEGALELLAEAEKTAFKDEMPQRL